MTPFTGGFYVDGRGEPETVVAPGKPGFHLARSRRQFRIVRVDEVEMRAARDTVEQRERPIVLDAVPAHVRDLAA